MPVVYKCLVLSAVCLGLCGSIVHKAHANPAVGHWKMIDDKTKKPSSIVHIYQKAGVLYAKVVKLLNLKPGESPNPLCDKCKGKRKNKRILGMTFVWGMKKKGKLHWGDGKILDPDDGKVYGCTMWLQKGRKVLNVRGCIFWPLCRTQKWYRVPSSKSPAKKMPTKKAPARSK